ncbi:MinD/ParA family ATP-binding protein [Kineococcus sp. SYSU DK003]|uniref:MinD/ParA family ATP-binding protein n=1 Tax=Kineococcus sp. SYSU DK003 TaxID=3383124 RepID=UPI003D7ED5A3
MTIDLTTLEPSNTHRFEVVVDPDGEVMLTLNAPDADTSKVWECRDVQAAERVAMKQARLLAQRSSTPLTVVLAADGIERTFTVTESSATETQAPPADEPVTDGGNDGDGDGDGHVPAQSAPAPESVLNAPASEEDPGSVEDLPRTQARPTTPRPSAGSRLRTAAAALDQRTGTAPDSAGKRRLLRPKQADLPPLNLPKAPPISQPADDLERAERRFRLRRPQIPTAGREAQPVSPTAPEAVTPPRPQTSEATVNRTLTGRVTFLPEHDPAAQPATRGWRGALNLMGAHLRPDERELAYRADEAAAATTWTGPRTIAVVNGKGGAGKTPTTAMLAAVFAHYGSSTLAWDNNPLRGTLGWRTEQANHEATILDLLENTGPLGGPSARAADLTAFLHHQRADRFDVLRSQPRRLASDRRVLGPDVDEVHRIVSKFYRLIVMDSGNDESDPMWRAMIKHTDQLVVVTTTQAGTAEAGALLLDSLTDRGGHGAQLARDAVAVITQADRSVKPDALRAIEAGYRDLVAPERVVTIPHDPGMVEGALRLRELRAATQRAWLAAAATIARAMPQDVEGGKAR